MKPPDEREAMKAEVARRYRAGESLKQIGDSLGFSRGKIAGILDRADALGITKAEARRRHSAGVRRAWTPERRQMQREFWRRWRAGLA